MLITFEGIDGSGKSTQIKLLSKHLNSLGIKHILTREPGGTEVAEGIRNILKKGDLEPISELLLLYTSRLEHLNKLILPNKDSIVISDRFEHSTIAYQHYGRGVPIEYIEQVREMTIGKFKPDITFLIDVNIKTRDERVKNRGILDHIELEDREFHKRVIDGYRELCEKEKHIFLINGKQHAQVISKQIIKILKKTVLKELL